MLRLLTRLSEDYNIWDKSALHVFHLQQIACMTTSFNRKIIITAPILYHLSSNNQIGVKYIILNINLRFEHGV